MWLSVIFLFLESLRHGDPSHTRSQLPYLVLINACTDFGYVHMCTYILYVYTHICVFVCVVDCVGVWVL